MSIFGGAAKGAAAGSAAGPWGAAIGGVTGLLGGIFGSRAQDKAAQAEADNQNAGNAYQNRLATAQYNTEQMPYRQQSSKMRSWRDTFMKAVMRNPNNGLSKIFGDYGGAGSPIAYSEKDVAPVRNPYEVAGPPPQMKAVKGGWGGAIGAGLSGAASGALTGYNLGREIGRA